MEVLVTGGAGFIGSNTTELLVSKGYKVTVLDNLVLGKTTNLQNVRNKIKFVRGTVTDSKIVNRLVRGKEFVFHLASASSAPMYEPDPREATEVEVGGFLNVMDAARRHDVKQVVWASSSSIYGGVKPPHREDMPVTSVSFYVAAKLARENYGRVYSDVYGIRNAGMRYFSIYGPHEISKGRFANVVSQFLWEMAKGKTPVIYGDGSQTRDYVYVKDAAAANVMAAEKSATGIFNVGTGRAASFNDIVALLNKEVGTNIRPKYIKNPIKNYIAHTLADTQKLNRVLGFVPRWTLEKGVRELVRLYKAGQA